jgi:hypothetical protein
MERPTLSHRPQEMGHCQVLADVKRVDHPPALPLFRYRLFYNKLMAPGEAPHPDFQRIYLDTNVLLRGQGWPDPSILLNNLLRLASLCGIDRFVPEPVFREAEEHWLRRLKEGASKLLNAKRELHKVANPIRCDITLEHSPIETLLVEYRRKVSDSVKKYGIGRTPFTTRTVEDLFGFATKYLLPFAPNAEGKGFQDVVILLSILDHLNSSPGAKAVFVTADNDFAGIDLASFMPEFDSLRLRIINLETLFDFLSKRYYEESIIKPYQQEVKNASTAVEAQTPKLAEFVNSLVTVEMMKPSGFGGTVTKLLSLEFLTVLSVDTPLPDPDAPDRSVEILIKVVAAYKVLMSGGVRFKNGLSSLNALLAADTFEIIPSSEEQETYAFWRGGIQATAKVVDREFTNIEPTNLAPEDSALREPPTTLKARGSAEFWMTRKIEEELVGRTKIPAGETPVAPEFTASDTSENKK